MEIIPDIIKKIFNNYISNNICYFISRQIKVSFFFLFYFNVFRELKLNK